MPRCMNCRSYFSATIGLIDHLQDLEHCQKLSARIYDIGEWTYFLEGIANSLADKKGETVCAGVVDNILDVRERSGLLDRLKDKKEQLMFLRNLAESLIENGTASLKCGICGGVSDKIGLAHSPGCVVVELKNKIAQLQ